MTDPLSAALDQALEMIGATHERMPVYNNEPRPQPENNRALWGALMSRDGGKCWMCGRTDGMLVPDHLRPRSNFRPNEMHIADRSDNLRIACWACNQDKSNRQVPFRKPLPIVFMCIEEAVHPEHAEAYLEFYAHEEMTAYCAQHHAVVTVPVNWPVATLR